MVTEPPKFPKSGYFSILPGCGLLRTEIAMAVEGCDSKATAADKYRQTIGPYQGCPGQRRVGSGVVSSGAVLIGPFEGSRWCGGCGGLWDLDSYEPVLWWFGRDDAGFWSS